MQQNKEDRAKLKEQENHNIELRTERMHELLGAAPGKLIRYGISVVFGIVVLLVIFAAFFRYPQTHQAAIVLSAENPVAWIVPQLSGRIERIFVSNRDTVSRGELMAVIHSTANLDDMFVLREYTDSLAVFIPSFNLANLPSARRTLRLGELQDIYAQLVKRLDEYKVFYTENSHHIESGKQSPGMQSGYIKANNAYRANIVTVYEQLLNRIQTWENTYTLKSPTDGIVSFMSVWSSNQNVNAAERVFAVVPLEPGRVTGRCMFSVRGAGKIRPGQSVIIKLDGFSYMEYGVLRGEIEDIAAIPIEVGSQYGTARMLPANIELRNGFTTSYGTEIPFPGEMSGVAEVTIENLTLLQHFIAPLKHLWNNNFGKNR